MAVITYLEAIRQALFDEMGRDERVFVMGEDVGEYGGAFKVTEGLIDRFGEKRVIDTISEAAMPDPRSGRVLHGHAAGVRIQFIDFTPAASTCSRTSPPVRNGAGFRSSARPAVAGSAASFHSLNLESFFLNTPGLEMVEPSTAMTPALLKAAIRR